MYGETHTLLGFFEKENLPLDIAIHPGEGLGPNRRISTVRMRSDNMRMFIKMLKENRIYYP
ncbi:MAG: hypothetical protein CL607_15985 [Anaerolineaceae bacterium]|nr:hypothetical protein [Anaerolineaceae bacterium]